MGLPLSVTNYFDSRVVEAYYAPQEAINLIAKGDPLPPGTRTVSRDQVERFSGKATRGYNIRTVKRETGERTPKTVVVVEHKYGFSLTRKDLKAYERMGVTALNGNDAYQTGQIIGKSLDEIILIGDANSGVKGLFTDAGAEPYEVTSGKEWNVPNGVAPDDTLVEAIAQLEATQLYTGLPMKLALDPLAYGQLTKRIPNTEATYLDFVAKQPCFPNGTEDIRKSVTLGAGTGWLGYFSPMIAERNIEEDINIWAVNGGIPDKDDLIYYNGCTAQATDIHHTDAMMQLTNLVDTTP